MSWPISGTAANVARHQPAARNIIYKCKICHAEMNAVLNAKGADLKGCTLYLNMYPCVECSKIITQSGITTIVYLLDEKADQWVQKPKYKKAREFDAELETKGLIKIRKYKAKKTRPSIQINFI
ncbi:probable deoxycytidylate deaminase isoform X2 [Trichoplusia ni]|uniref:dCMP deaminase n=1 Tax=Trichoplusia ni TaxID=7111 RepID=A0A7E5W8Q0_TRINI|nr:probable deoxycytidylate deaminase isoform X2 [Trichoplusia ni]